MSHGQLDFGMYSLARTIYKLTDMGELAARLGSIITYDRRGDVVWFDDFESDISQWEITGAEAGYAAVQSAERCRMGGFSCKMTTPAIGGTYVGIRKYLPLPVISKIGAEISFSMTSDIQQYRMELQFFNGTSYWTARVTYNRVNEILTVLDGSTYRTIASGLSPYIKAQLFNILKVVVDPLNTGNYVRIIFLDEEYDVSAYSLFSGSSATAPRIKFEFQVTGVGDVARVAFADCAIITQNEP